MVINTSREDSCDHVVNFIQINYQYIPGKGCVCAYTYMCVSVRIHICVSVPIYIYIYIYIYVCVFVCVCSRVHIKRQQAQIINISKHPSRPTSINLNTTIHTVI